LPPSPSAILFADDKEGKDNDTDTDAAAAAADTDAAADNAAAADDADATMSPKLKAPPRKPGAKKKIKGESDDDVAAMPPPTPKPQVGQVPGFLPLQGQAGCR
jgi:hypothetical protein